MHEEEYVFDARPPRRIGVQTLDALREGALRDYAGSGFVTAGPSPVVLAGRGPGATGRDAVAAQSTTMNIHVTFDWQAAVDPGLGRMCTVTLVNERETF